MKFVAESIQNDMGQVFFKTTYAQDMNVSLSAIKGHVEVHTLPFDEFKAVLGMSGKPVESWVHVPKGFIPGSEDSGYIDGYVSKEGWSAVWRVKGEVRQLIHTSGHYRVPFPDLIFAVTVKKGAVYRDYCFALDGDKVCQYPFGNVNDCGSICMGNIHISNISNIKDFEEEFFLGKTNNDYFHPGDHVKVKYSQDELLRRLSGKETFPKRWLIKRKLTLKDVIKMADPMIHWY